MNKRILALFCAVVMTVSMCAFGIEAVAATNKYQVGYAIKEINPWIDGDYRKGIIPGLKLSGRGANDNKRFCVGIWDDDCDGTWYGEYYYDSDKDGFVDQDKDKSIKGNGYDPDDGLFTTCTAITDANGNTVLFITLDTLGAFSNLTNDARAQIIKNIKADPSGWGNVNVMADAIILNGSHTHSSLRISDTSVYGCYDGVYSKTADNYQATQYYKRLIDQIVAAAKEACRDRAEATMYKSSVDVSEVLSVKGITNQASKLQLNFVRQYNQYYRANIDKLGIKEEGYHVIAGSNFGWQQGVQKYMAEKYAAAFKAKTGREITQNDVTVLSIRKDDKDELVSVDGKEAPADDMMHLIEFRFASNSGKLPVVMLNWRAHTTENGGDYFGAASSDYVGPLRTLLKQQGYRVAFFLGAAGNLVINSRMSTGYLLTPWRQPLSTATSYYNSKWKSDVHLYADLLKQAALTKLGGKGTLMSSPGDIRVTTSTFYAEKQNYSDGWIAALNALLKDANNDESVWKWNNTALYPYRYEHTDGKTYIIASYFHASTINGRKGNKPGDAQGVTLSAVALGNAASFVTAPFEISDRYYDNLQNGNMLDNDWNDLKDIIGSGSPFVLSCTNGYVSYLPSSLEYIFNTQEYYDIFSKNNTVKEYQNYAKDGMQLYGPGNYESHISPLASGAGELMIDQFEVMLKSLKNDTYAKPSYCGDCGQNVIWQPIRNVKIGSLEAGHYYLTEDISPENGAKQIAAVGSALCIDLRGFDYHVNDTAFHPYQYSVLTVRDSVGGGNVISHDVNKNYGAAVIVSGNSKFNWYADGTLSCVAEPTEQAPAARTIFSYGTVNVYNGTILGGKVISGASSYYDNGCGATVYLPGSGRLNVYGGNVASGDAVKGDCVYIPNTTCKVALASDGVIDEIYFNKLNTATNTEQLILSGGTANLVFDPAIPLTNGQRIGIGVDASGLKVIQPDGFAIRSELDALLLVRSGYIAQNGDYLYKDLDQAILTYKGGVIELLDDVVEEVFVHKDAVIDLNGFDITGMVTVPEGSTLYCMDSATDDYDIEDDIYGKITNYTGNIKGVTSALGEVDKDYLKVTEADAISFHRVNLRLTHVTLVPETASIRYKSAFEGDRLVAENVRQFGIAFNLRENPNATNMVEGTYSKFDTFKPGFNANGTTAGTSVVNIMKSSQSDDINGQNAAMPIYGSAYILTNEGEYIFGRVENKTFRQVVEGVNSYWHDLNDYQKNAAVALYKQFEGNMQYWGLANIKSAAAK